MARTQARGGMFEVAKCRRCRALYVTFITTELHGTVFLPMECPRCQYYDYDLVDLPEDVYERLLKRGKIIVKHYR